MVLEQGLGVHVGFGPPAQDVGARSHSDDTAVLALDRIGFMAVRVGREEGDRLIDGSEQRADSAARHDDRAFGAEQAAGADRNRGGIMNDSRKRRPPPAATLDEQDYATLASFRRSLRIFL